MKQIIEDVELERLLISPTNPRKHFPEESIIEMAKSLSSVGLIEPLVVRSNHNLPNATGKLEIVCGERRFRGASIAKLKTLLCIVKELSDDQMFDIQVSENLHREDVSPLDEADSFYSLMQRKKMTLEDIALKYGKTEEYIFNRLRLMNLTSDAKAYLENDVLPVTAAIKIATLSEQLQKQAIKRTISLNEVNGEKKFIFAGLRDLKSFFENNVTMPLKLADFNPEDAKLCPQAGNCTQCAKRTGAGLFKDFLDNDKCLDAACYKDKQIAHYQKLKDKLAKTIKQPIVFCARAYNGEKEYKALGEVLTFIDYREVESEKLTEKDKKELQYAIYVGVNRHPDEDDAKNSHGWIQVTRKVETAIKNGVSKVDAQKEKEKKDKEKLIGQLTNEILFEQFKEQGFKSISSLSSYLLAADLFDGCNNMTAEILLDIVKRYSLTLKISMFDGKEWVDVELTKNFDGVLSDNFSTSHVDCFDAVNGMDPKKIMCLMNEILFIDSLNKAERLEQFVDEFELDPKAAKRDATLRAKSLAKEAKVLQD